MLTGFMSVIIKSAILQGGLLNIISDSQHGGRLNFGEYASECFDTNPLRRHTFWTITIGGTFVWASIYGINQAQVQRYNSCKSISHARVALYINLLGLVSILLCSVSAGLCLFSVYKSCDPWTAGHISAPDQMMPYLVMDILGDNPGLPGLFVAAVYSGSLSTVSSSINALATVTVEDVIKPFTNMSEKHVFWLSKGLSLIYGFVCIGMAGLASLMGGILQAAVSILGVIGGPLLGLFSLGILCPFANSKGALSGLVSGLVLSLWVCIGALMCPPPAEMRRPLPLSTEGCNFTADHLNLTSIALPTEATSITTALAQSSDGKPLLAHYWYSLSYLYFSPIGTVTAISVGLLMSFLTGGSKLKSDSNFTLLKEDTTLYHSIKFLKDRVTMRKGKLDLTKDRARIFGDVNPTFCDIELDITKSNTST